MIFVALRKPFSVSLDGWYQHLRQRDKLTVIVHSLCWGKGKNQIMKCLSQPGRKQGQVFEFHLFIHCKLVLLVGFQEFYYFYK